MSRRRWACGLLLGLMCAGSARGQEWRRFEVGAQTTMLEALGQTDWSAVALKTHWSVGPAATFNINQHFAIDGAVTYFRDRSGNPSMLVGGNLTQALIGLKVTVRGSRLGLFANVRPGIVRWSQGRVTNITYPNWPNQVPEVDTYAPRTNFGLEFGGGFEYAITPRFALRTDAGIMATMWRHYKGRLSEPPYDGGSPTGLHFSTGIYYRFGAPICMRAPGRADSHKFLDKTNLALFSASLLAKSADAITTQRSLANCRKHSPYPNDPHSGCAQLEGNIITRPFAARGWAGVVPFTAMAQTLEVLTSFALHKMGHHRVERIWPAYNALESGVVAYQNTKASPMEY